MRKLFFGCCFVLILIHAPILFAQQAPGLPALKEEALSETDKLQTFTQQMVDEIFSFSELVSRNTKPLATSPPFWEKMVFTSSVAWREFQQLGLRPTEAANL